MAWLKKFRVETTCSKNRRRKENVIGNCNTTRKKKNIRRGKQRWQLVASKSLGRRKANAAISHWESDDIERSDLPTITGHVWDAPSRDSQDPLDTCLHFGPTVPMPYVCLSAPVSVSIPTYSPSSSHYSVSKLNLTSSSPHKQISNSNSQ